MLFNFQGPPHTPAAFRLPECELDSTTVFVLCQQLFLSFAPLFQTLPPLLRLPRLPSASLLKDSLVIIPQGFRSVNWFFTLFFILFTTGFSCLLTIASRCEIIARRPGRRERNRRGERLCQSKFLIPSRPGRFSKTRTSSS